LQVMKLVCQLLCLSVDMPEDIQFSGMWTFK
jgi:hypothetical protein